MPIKRSRPKATGVPGITQDGPDRFLVRVQWIDKRTGRRKERQKVAQTLAEAAALKEDLKNTQPTELTSKQPFRDYAKSWLKSMAPSLALSTRERYAAALAHATVAFGDVYVDMLKPSDIRRWKDSSKVKYAPSTFNGWLCVIRVVLEPLVEDGVFVFNPARKVKRLTEGRTKGRRGKSLSVEEFKVFVETVQALSGNKLSVDTARMLLTAAWTGMRRGEILALRWEDYQHDDLHVERAVWRRQEKTNKTDDPRLITVVAPLKEVLKEQRQWLLRTQHPGMESGLVFPASPRHAKASASRRGVDTVSWFRSMSIFDKPIAKVVKQSGIPEISVQSLRRTWENLLRAAGVPDLVRRSIAGWRSKKAQAIYADVKKEERDEASNAVLRMVEGM